MVVINPKISAFLFLASLLYVVLKKTGNTKAPNFTKNTQNHQSRKSENLFKLTCWSCSSINGVPDIYSCSYVTCSDIAMNEEFEIPAQYAFCVKTEMQYGGEVTYYEYRASCMLATSLDDNAYCTELANRTDSEGSLIACEQCRSHYCNSY